MGQDRAPLPGNDVKVGPLGCLGLLAAAIAGWAAGRLPEIAMAANRDILAVSPVVPDVPRPAAQVAAVAPAPVVVAAPAAPAPQVIVLREIRTVVTPAPQAEPAELKWTLPPTAAAAPVATAPTVPATAVASVPAPGPGFAIATQAYADLKHGDKRAAAAEFAAAIDADPKAEQVPAWKKELKTLRKRWSGEAYTLLRDGGTVGLGVTPVLGGGQSSAQIAYTPMPLARRPVYAVLRTTTSNSGGFGKSSAGPVNSQIAAGLRWQVLPQLSISGERLFAVAHSGRSAFTVRVSGGATHRFGPVLADAYAEAGVVGFHHADPFASVQARAVVPFALSAFRFEPGAGLWSGYQNAGFATERVDLGPTLGIAWDRWHVKASADYRFKVAGNATPGSGPAVTVAGQF